MSQVQVGEAKRVRVSCVGVWQVGKSLGENGRGKVIQEEVWCFGQRLSEMKRFGWVRYLLGDSGRCWLE